MKNGKIFRNLYKIFEVFEGGGKMEMVVGWRKTSLNLLKCLKIRAAGPAEVFQIFNLKKKNLEVGSENLMFEIYLNLRVIYNIKFSLLYFIFIS